MSLEEKIGEKKNLCFHFNSAFGDPSWIKNILKNPDTEKAALGTCEYHPCKLPIGNFVDGEFVFVDGENYRLVGETFFPTPNYFVHISIWEYAPTKKVGSVLVWNNRIVRDYSFGCETNWNVLN